MKLAYQIAVISTAALLSGCASAQLNYDTLQIASTTSDLEIKQVLDNIETFRKDRNAIPAEVLIAGGTVSTQYTFTPSLTLQLSRVLQGVLTTGSTNVGPSGSLALEDQKTWTRMGGATFGNQWTQNWSIQVVTDAIALKRLVKLYRYASTRVNKYDDTPPPLSQKANPAHIDETLFATLYLRDNPAAKLADIQNAEATQNAAYITDTQPKLQTAEITDKSFKENAEGGGDVCLRVYGSKEEAEKLSAAEGHAVPLTKYGYSNRFITQAQYDSDCLQRFVIAVHEAAGATSSVDAAKSSGTAKSSNFVLTLPQSQLLQAVPPAIK